MGNGFPPETKMQWIGLMNPCKHRLCKMAKYSVFFGQVVANEANDEDTFR
jgi:hypothetical protein